VNISISNNFGAYGQLWLGVLQQAVADFEAGLNVERDSKGAKALLDEHRRAARWFASHNDGVGSFKWICSIFDMNPEQARKQIAEKTRETN
jgi:hypothetical protein